MDGAVVPVELLASAGELLKSHWVMIAASLAAVRMKVVTASAVKEGGWFSCVELVSGTDGTETRATAEAPHCNISKALSGDCVTVFRPCRRGALGRAAQDYSRAGCAPRGAATAKEQPSKTI
jgi:hypothetical protein